MSTNMFEGEWSLPGGVKQPGRIVFDKDKKRIELQIFGAAYIEGELVKGNKPYYHPEHFHPIIYGDGQVEITLYNCSWTGSDKLTNDLYQVNYKIGYLINGIHLKTNGGQIRGGTFMFSHLSTWFDGDLFLEKLKGDDAEFFDGSKMVKGALTTDEIQVRQDLKLILQDEVTTRIEQINISNRTVFRKYVHFKYETDIPFQQLLKDAVTFLKLLKFCFAKPLAHEIVAVHADKGEKKLSYLWVSNYSLSKRIKLESFSVPSNHMLLYKSHRRPGEIGEIIIKWFNNQQYYNIYEYYLDSNDWFHGTGAMLSNVMFNNRFLNLVQGLEDYYREFFETNTTAADRQLFDERKKIIMDGIEDDAIRKWFNDSFRFSRYPSITQKLAAIVTDLREDLNELFTGISLEQFPATSSGFRNKLSHGQNKEINLGKDLHRDYYIAQVLLGVCILKTLGIDNLKTRVSRYMKFKDAAEQIRYYQENGENT